jgi:hypothetical protein
MLYFHDQGKRKKHHSRFCPNCSYIMSHEGMGIGHVSLPRNRYSVQVSTFGAKTLRTRCQPGAKAMCAVVLVGWPKEIAMSSLFESGSHVPPALPTSPQQSRMH